MKRCLNCRRTYEDKLTRCPFCGYRPRTKTSTNTSASANIDNDIKPKAAQNNFGDTQVYAAPRTASPAPKPQPRAAAQNNSNNINSNSSYTGAFYLQSGEKINSRYSVINVMGFGTFGVAYECFDTNTMSNVVVKEYFPSFIANRSRRGRDIEAISEQSEAAFEIGVDRFIDENKKLLDNDVRCVPAMRDCFRENNTSYVVTELVRGEALSSIIRRKGRLPYQATINIITGVLQGLRKLNKLGIIHGDICPDNIIVTNNSEVYLLDYNLSDFNKTVYTQRDSGKLRAGYSALELYYLNMEHGPWTDVYAAAAVMYKMMTGITVPSAIKRKTSDTLTPPSKLGVSITQSAEKAMLRALKVDYEKRTQNPEDFLNGLTGDGFDDVAIAKQTAPVPTKSAQAYTDYAPAKSSDSNRILVAILIFLITAIIGVIMFLLIAGVIGPLKDKKDTGRDSDVSSVSSSITDTDTDTESETETDTGTESKEESDSKEDEESSEKETDSEEDEESSEAESVKEESVSDETESSEYVESSEYSEYVESSEEETYSETESSEYVESSEEEIYSETESSEYVESSEEKSDTEKTDLPNTAMEVSTFFEGLFDQVKDFFDGMRDWV